MPRLSQPTVLDVLIQKDKRIDELEDRVRMAEEIIAAASELLDALSYYYAADSLATEVRKAETKLASAIEQWGTLADHHRSAQ